MKLPENTNRRTVLKTLGTGAIGGVALAGNAAAKPRRETKSFDVATGTPFDAVDENGNTGPFADPDTLLYEPVESDPDTEEGDKTGAPLIAPDGTQITWGEWSAASGTVTLKCLEEGTQAKVHGSDLIEKGVYTIWIILPGTGGGPLGPNDGSESAFDASASGEGNIVTIHEPKTIPLPPGNENEYKKCLLDEKMAWIIADFHNDGQTHGTVPLPHGVDHFIATF